jgi:hypothetical protein
MSNYIKNTSILDMWNNTDDCDHFIQNVKNKASKLGATVKIHPFILFHPGYNIRGGHRRAVYLVSNSIYSFVFYCQKPQDGRLNNRRIRRLAFIWYADIKTHKDSVTINMNGTDVTFKQPLRLGDLDSSNFSSDINRFGRLINTEKLAIDMTGPDHIAEHGDVEDVNWYSKPNIDDIDDNLGLGNSYISNHTPNELREIREEKSKRLTRSTNTQSQAYEDVGQDIPLPEGGRNRYKRKRNPIRNTKRKRKRSRNTKRKRNRSRSRNMNTKRKRKLLSKKRTQ